MNTRTAIRITVLAILCSFGLTVATQAKAEVRLPAVISDGMLIQQGQDFTVWGWADPEESFGVCWLSPRNEGASVSHLIGEDACKESRNRRHNSRELYHQSDSVQVGSYGFVEENVKVHILHRPGYLAEKAE